MKVGDLVRDNETPCPSGHLVDAQKLDTGLIITVMADVEIPPLIEVMWEDGTLSRCYADQLELVGVDVCRAQ